MTNLNLATATPAQLKEAGYTVKTLKTRKARKHETCYTRGYTGSTYRVKGGKMAPINGAATVYDWKA